MKTLIQQITNIVKGGYQILNLKSDWCTHIGNTTTAFLWALLLNLVTIPLSVYVFPETADPVHQLPNFDQLALGLLMNVIMLVVVFLLALAHRRRHKFALIYAGATYVMFIITSVLWGVEALMTIYEHSLYAQDAPLLARGVLMLTVIWMVVAISFVFKTALEIRAAISLLMACILLFALVVGQQFLQLTLFSA